VRIGAAVTIAGRAFELGAVYRPVRSRKENRPRRLVGHDPAHAWPGGRVEVEVISPGVTADRPGLRRWMSGAGWARWAGEEVEPG
jgi:hypothetical protein